jgi:hypothetical protein
MKRRLQWTRDLTHEMSSTTRVLRSWFRILLELCLSVCIYSVFVLSRPCDGLIPRPRSSTAIYKIHNFRLNSGWEQARDYNPST